ncbi:hypothetical protein PIB30_111807, partial [Stylosanthes scabra]|nr:hypothetical protein [Stylosanthes scabra]
GSMTIGKYVDKFEELSKFSMFLKHHPDSQWKATQFELGLRPEIKEKIATLEIKDYNLLVNKARIAEKTYLEAEFERERQAFLKRKRGIEAQKKNHFMNEANQGNNK